MICDSLAGRKSIECESIDIKTTVKIWMDRSLCCVGSGRPVEQVLKTGEAKAR